MESFLSSRQVHYPHLPIASNCGHDANESFYINPSLGKSGSNHRPKQGGSAKEGFVPRIKSSGYIGLPSILIILPQLSFFVSCKCSGSIPGNARWFHFLLNFLRYSTCSKLPMQFRPLRKTSTVKQMNRVGQNVLSLSICNSFSSFISKLP